MKTKKLNATEAFNELWAPEDMYEIQKFVNQQRDDKPLMACKTMQALLSAIRTRACAIVVGQHKDELRELYVGYIKELHAYARHYGEELDKADALPF